MKVDVHNNSGVFAWIFVISFVGILGIAAILLGVIAINTENGSIPLGIALIIGGIPALGWAGFSLIKFNKQYHKDKIAAIKSNPELILCAWKDGEKEYLLTLTGLVADEKFIAFSDYSYTLSNIEHQEKDNEQTEIIIAVERLVSGEYGGSNVTHHFKYILPPTIVDESKEAAQVILVHYDLLK